MTVKRTKLDPVNVNMLVYLRENMNKIKIEKLVLEDQEEEKLEKENTILQRVGASIHSKGQNQETS